MAIIKKKKLGYKEVDVLTSKVVDTQQPWILTYILSKEVIKLIDNAKWYWQIKYNQISYWINVPRSVLSNSRLSYWKWQIVLTVYFFQGIHC